MEIFLSHVPIKGTGVLSSTTFNSGSQKSTEKAKGVCQISLANLFEINTCIINSEATV